MIRIVRVVRDRELHALDLAVEVVANRTVVRRYRGTRILTDIEAVVGGEDHRQRCLDVPLADLLAVGVKGHLAALAEAAAGVGELHADLVLPRGERVFGLNDEGFEAAPVVAILELALVGIQGPPADVGALADDDALSTLLRHHDFGGDGVRLVLEVEDAVFRQASHAADEELGLTLDEHRPAGEVRVELLQQPVVQGQHLVARRLDQPLPLQLVELLRHLLGEIVRLGPVLVRVELPHIVVECGPWGHDPGRVVLRDRGPALVVNAAIAHDLEVLHVMLLGGLGVVERVEHADPLDRVLLNAVHRNRLRQTGRLEDRRGHVNHVGKLRANLAPGFDALGPVDDGAVARAAPVGGDLLGPLVGGVHGVRPAHGVVVVGFRPAEFVDPLREVLGRLEGLQLVEVAHLVEGPVDPTLGRGAVVTDNVVNERVVEDVQLLQQGHDPANMVIGVFQEARIHLHLPAQHGLERFGHRIPGRYLLGARGELAVRRDDPELLLPGERLLPQFVPALVELALVFVGPFFRNVVGRMRGARGEVDEERLVGREHLLLRNPFDGLVGHVRHEVVALLGRLLVLNRRGPFVEGRIPLVRLAAEEAVEVLEATAACRPSVKGADGAGLPDGDFVVLAELRGGVAVEFERLRQGRHGVGPNRTVARRAGRNLGDAGHADGMVVAPGEQRLAGRRGNGGGVETRVPQSIRRQLVQSRRLAGPAEGARGPEAGVVDQDEQDIGRALGRAQLLDGGKLRVRALRVVGDQAWPNRVRHGKMGAVLELGRAGRHRAFQ